MPSLAQVLAKHHSVLLLDAASARVQVGWLSETDDARWQESDEEAGIGVFRCLEALGRDVTDPGAYVFCEGPGSILGIRTVAMVLRAWAVLKPATTYAYSSLAVVAQALGRDDVTVIADARRESWHACTLGGPLRRVAAHELAGELVMPEHFRHWSPLPHGVHAIPYSLPALLPQIRDADLFHVSTAPDAFLHEAPQYVTWTPQIHRAPGSS